MDSTEILTNDQVTEVGNEITTAAANSKFLKVAVGLGLGVLICGVAYKYVIKPIIKKHKAKKETEEVDDFDIFELPDFDDDDEEETK